LGQGGGEVGHEWVYRVLWG
jgi:hypothetical protein